MMQADPSTESPKFPSYLPIYKDAKFRDPQGRLLYSKLFFERTVPETRGKALYTLKDQDHEGCLSLYQKYLEVSDPTEYRFAAEYFESYEHWVTLTKQDWFQPYLERFRRDLETKIRSHALKAIMIESRAGGKNSFLANKYLLEKGWIEKEKNQKGRPSDIDIKNAAKDLAEDQKKAEEDYLRVISG